MHVHGNHLNPAATNLNSAAAAESAAAARRAAEVRKKLKAGAAKIDADLDGDAINAVGGESNQGSRQRHDKHTPQAQKKKQDADEAPSADPISIWG